MEIINYFECENKAHWLTELSKSDWTAAAFLHNLIKTNRLFRLVGEGARLLLLVDGTRLISFCTLAARDDIQPTTLAPWIGFVYTFPAYRGHRYAGKLLSHAEAIAKKEGAKQVYVSTTHVGLYEKYGYAFRALMQDVHGDASRVYQKTL